MNGFSLDAMHRLLWANLRLSQEGCFDPGELRGALGVLPSPTRHGCSGQPEPILGLSSCSQQSPSIPLSEEEPQGAGPVLSALWRSCPSSRQRVLMLLIP